MEKLLVAFTLLVFVITACGPQAQPTEGSPLPSDGTVSYPNIPSYPNGDSYPNGNSYPSDSSSQLTPAQQAAVTVLSGTLNLPPGKITVISTDAVDWPNGCLGIQKKDLFCTEAIVPGYKIILQAEGKLYEIRTNSSGSQVAQATDTSSTESVEDKAVNQLAQNLGLDVSEVTLVSSSDMEFGDICLNVALPDTACAQIMVPGKQITLSANGVKYEYHASADGTLIQPATLALVWKREGGIAGFCDSLIVFLSGEVSGGQCKSQPESVSGTFAGLLSTDELDQFNGWIQEFGEVSIDASNPVGVSDRMVVTLAFHGNGKATSLTESDQQALFTWVQNLFQRLYN